MTAEDQPSRRLKFDLQGDLQEVMRRVKSVETFLLDAGCSAESAQQMAVVAEEMFANIVQDAWAGREPGRCIVELTVAATDAALHVSLRTDDDGIAFDPTEAKPPDLDASLEDRPIGGLGILLIKTMTDSQIYQRRDNHNIFEVRKICPLTS